MDQSVIEVLGKITALEFVLSLIVANNYVRLPHGDTELARFAEAVDQALRFRTTVLASPISADAAMAIQTAAVEAADQFFRRTADRFEEIAKG